MRTSLDLLSAIAEIDSYLDEGTGLIFQAEERLLQLERDGACRGHLLIGAQILKAMRRNLRLIQERRSNLEREIAAVPFGSSEAPLVVVLGLPWTPAA